MKKIFAGTFFLILSSLSVYATLLSDRSIPSLRETFTYSVQNILAGTVGEITQVRNSRVTSVLVGGKVVTTFTESDDGRGVLTDVIANKTLMKISFPRPIFSLGVGEAMGGTLSFIGKDNRELLKVIPIVVNVSEISGLLVHTYTTTNDDIKEIKMVCFRQGERLPFEMIVQKTRLSSDKLLSHIVLIRQ